MNKNLPKRIVLLLSVVSICAFAQEWGEPLMPVSDVRPGMRGFLKTVFYGDTIEQIEVEIIEVMHNFYPKRDVILARLLGEKAEYTGVVSGMSGSPVYIDGKLVGALAYRFGEFMKEPIAGITPIASMTEIVRYESARPAAASYSAVLPKFVQGTVAGVDEDFWPALVTAESSTESLETLSRISCPLVFSGFEAKTVQSLQPLFSHLGFTSMIGGSASKASSNFSPGSAVSIVFLSGDYSIEATGTVTAVQGRQLLAFGHQLFNLGAIRLPLAAADVYTTLPSLMGSSKMASAGEVRGTFLQDRMSGVFGDLSVLPKMIPISLTVESVEGEAQHFSFSLADDPSFNNILPLFLRTAIIQGAFASRLSGDQNSSRMTGDIRLCDGRSVPFDDLFTSRQRLGFIASGVDAVSAADLAATALGALMVHDFQGPTIESVNLTLKAIAGENYAFIESVWLDKTVINAGDSVEVIVTLRDNKERKRTLTQTISIPKNLAGNRLSLFVSSAASLSNFEAQTTRSRFVPRDFDHLLRLINNRRRPQNLYIQLRAEDTGLLVEGEELTELPPSVAAVMSARTARGFAVNLRDRVVAEHAVAADHVILGAQRLALQVKPASLSRTVGQSAQRSRTGF